jgi:hypothetical protein
VQLDKWRFSTTAYKRKSAKVSAYNKYFQHRLSIPPTLKKALKSLKKGIPGGSDSLNLQGVSTGLFEVILVYTC